MACSWCSASVEECTPGARSLGGPYCGDCFLAWQLYRTFPCPACLLPLARSRLLAHASSRQDPSHLAVEVMSS